MELESLRFAALMKACDFAEDWQEAMAIADSFLDYMAGDAIQFTVTTND